MSTNHVKIYLDSAALENHYMRVYNAGLDRKARRWGFHSIEQCWAICDTNPFIERIVTALFSGSAPAFTARVDVSRKKFIRMMKKRWGNKHTKASLIQLYRSYNIVDSKKKGNLPKDN